MSSERSGSGPSARDGTAQRDRFPEALREDYIRPDEMTLPDLITLLARLAANLRFEPRPESRRIRRDRAVGSEPSDWTDLFVDEPLVVLAEIASLRVAAERARLQRLSSEDELEAEVNHLAEQLLHWTRTLERRGGPEVEELQATLRAAVRHLDDLWTRSPGDATSLQASWRPFASARPREADVVLHVTTPSRTGTPDPAAALAHAGDRVLGLIAEIQDDCLAVLERLMRSQDHEPALALPLTFLHLFRRAQDALNTFARRRLEFYYLDVLRFSPLPRQPDEALLALATAPGTTQLTVPEGTGFSAGRDAGNRDIVFRTDRDLQVTDARVASIRALLGERDPRISPERELGFLTGIRLRTADPDPGEPDPTETVPLFRDLGRSDDEGTTAALGFAVASPTLHLPEGSRTLRLDIRLRPSPAHSTFRYGAGADAPETLDAHLHELGELFTLELLSSDPLPPDHRARRAEILARTLDREDLDEGSGRVLRELFDGDRRVVFQDLFRRALYVSYTAPEGWQRADNPFVAPLDDGVGLRVRLELGSGARPVVPHDPEVHGEGYATTLPVLRFRIRRDARFFPYSLLRCLELTRVDLEATVEGVTDLVAYNRLGPVDATRPFQPFGPLPDGDSAVFFGSYHASRTPLVRAWVGIEWGGLPSAPGAWRTHYLEYDQDYSGRPFQADIAVVRDRKVWPLEPEARPRAPLFARGPEDRLRRETTLELPVLDHFEPLPPAVSEAEFRGDPRQRNGIFRLSLTPSSVDFGHGAYPAVLTRAVQAAARSKKPVPQPNAPYTPVIDRLTLNYVARSSIVVGREPDAKRGGEKIFHDHPFGVFEITSAFSDERFPLMPGGPGSASATGGGVGHGHDGYIFLGLEASALKGRLSLLVQMVRSAPAERVEPDPPEWYYLASNRWRRFAPVQVVADTTHGFQRSGLVTLDVPGDLDTDNTILPGGLYWIAVGGDRLTSAAVRLHSVRTGGVRVVWDGRGESRADPGRPIPAGTIQAPVDRVPGLGTVVQVAPSSGGRPDEDFDRLAARASERLRHKGRAVSPWDYEHLVLERFPDVSKVKCFPNTAVESHPDEARGQVLLVVVPRLRPPAKDGWRDRSFSGVELEGIRSVVQEVAPAAAHVSVVNPVYEAIQVRCRVTLRERTRRGRDLDHINQALVDYLAPWTPDGRGGRFGWVVREKDVAALLYGLPFVDFVADVSLLHVSEDKDEPGSFFRRDTARTFQPSVQTEGLSPGVIRRRTEGSGAPWDSRLSGMDREVRARYPWSLAVPRSRHVVHALPGVETLQPHLTGVGELEIGRDFILEPNDE